MSWLIQASTSSRFTTLARGPRDSGPAPESPCPPGGRFARRSVMADLGEPVRVIEITPLEAPVPSEAPAIDPVPTPEPERVGDQQS